MVMPQVRVALPCVGINLVCELDSRLCLPVAASPASASVANHLPLIAHLPARHALPAQDESLPDFKDVIRFEPRELSKYFEVRGGWLGWSCIQ